MRFQYTINCFADTQHRGGLHGVTRKLDLDQTSMAHNLSILKDKCDKTHFSVRPRDFLHPSPLNSALYVVIMFVLVCLCRFLSVADYSYTSYELVAHFDLSLDLFLGDSVRLNQIKSLFSNSVAPLNLNKVSKYYINSTHSLLKCM